MALLPLRHRLNKKSKPVWVIVTRWFRAVPESEWEMWQTPAGKIRITYHEHAVLVTGFDTDHVYFNDPLAAVKNRKVPRNEFIAGWNPFGRQAISYL